MNSPSWKDIFILLLKSNFFVLVSQPRCRCTSSSGHESSGSPFHTEELFVELYCYTRTGEDKQLFFSSVLSRGCTLLTCGHAASPVYANKYNHDCIETIVVASVSVLSSLSPLCTHHPPENDMYTDAYLHINMRRKLAAATQTPRCEYTYWHAKEIRK